MNKIKSEHKNFLKDNPIYNRFCEDIKSGLFTRKLFNKNGKLYMNVSIDKKTLIDKVYMFYKMVKNVKSINCTVYRAISNVSTTEPITHPIPFSTTLDVEIALSWCSEGYSVYKIDVDSTTPFMILDYDPSSVFYEGEVSLAPGVLIPKKKENGLIHCNYQPISECKIASVIQHISEETSGAIQNNIG